MAALNRLVPWIVGAFVLSVSFAAMYLVAQQLDRQEADEAPARLASQVASQLTAAETDAQRVELDSSLAPFYVIYDASGSPQSGTGYLGGSLAEVPSGVVTAAAESGYNAVTWQPQVGLRFATVAVKAGDRVVLAGQSLEPSEKRTDQVGLLLAAGWAVALLLLAAGALVQSRLRAPSADGN